MEHKINYIETRALMKNINLAQTDPIALVTKAANIVLNDSENLEAIKAIESGRAFNVGGGFDPRKRPPPGGHSDYTGPTEWLQDMSLCDMCPAGTADAERRHLYRLCKHATPAKLEARKAERQKLFAERRASQNEQRSSGRPKKPRGDAKKAGGESGGAKVAAWHYADPRGQGQRRQHLLDGQWPAHHRSG